VPKIAGELIARGHSVAVVGGAPPEFTPDQAPPAPYPVHRVSRGLPFARRLLVALQTLLRAGRDADIFYVQGLAGPEMVAVLVARLLRKPVALKIVGDNAWEYAIRMELTRDGIDEFQGCHYPPKLRAIRALVHGYARLATRLIVPSEYLKGIVAGWGVAPHRVRVIRNALTAPIATAEDRIEARSWLRETLGIAGPLVVTSCRLYPWKNLDFLIRLVPQFPSDTTLLVVGGGPEHQRLLHEIARLGLDRRVRITGNVSHQDVQRYLRGADIFVLNTRYEGLSHVMLEAMAAGTPVVASRVGGNPEVIDDGRNGILVPLDDGAAIVHSIERLLACPDEATRLSAAARQDVRRFSWQELVDVTERTLLEAASRR
jgi:glycosyltransferase involved in cell wall biosynthesis